MSPTTTFHATGRYFIPDAGSTSGANISSVEPTSTGPDPQSIVAVYEKSGVGRLAEAGPARSAGTKAAAMPAASHLRINSSPFGSGSAAPGECRTDRGQPLIGAMRGAAQDASFYTAAKATPPGLHNPSPGFQWREVVQAIAILVRVV
jgi:hypothetical protein